MTREDAEKQYREYLEGHIGNVNKALEVLYSMNIPFVVDNIEELRNIVSQHDKSKYEEPEWSAYLHHFYPLNDEESKMEEEFESAVRYHIKNNKHHWDYWVDDKTGELTSGIDEQEYKLYTIERICDWLAMAGQHSEGPHEYYDVNIDSVIQPDYAKELCDEIFPNVPDDFSDDMWKGNRGELDESIKSIDRTGKGYLVEANIRQLKRVTLSQDPTRAKKSKNIQSKYIGISKYGVLNFETTSETHSTVKWYQELHFPSFNGFLNIIEQGDEIDENDVKMAIFGSDVKLSCFTEDSEVITSDGVKRIKDIKVGDKVLTHTGRYQEVIQTYENDYDGELIEINGIKSTPNHPYLVKLPNGDIKWMMACEITQDMLLLEISDSNNDNT